MLRQPSIKQLEAFLAIEACRNVTNAATRLNVSQPALSRTLRLTEEALGAPLFERNTRNVELTPAGMEMLPIARRLVGEFRESFGKLGKYLDGSSGRVVVAGLPSVVVALLPAALQRTMASAPDVEVKMLGMPEQQVLAMVRGGGADFGIVTQPAAADWLHFQRLVEDEYLLVCRRDDPLARKKKVPWAELAKRPFIAMAPSSSVRPVLDRIFVQLSLKVNACFETDNIGLVGPLVAAGLGLTVMPRLALALIDRTELAGVPLADPVAHRVVGSVHRTDVALSPVASRLLAALQGDALAPRGSRRGV